MNNYNNNKTFAELKDTVDIVEYIGSKIELKKFGNTFKACCPFHAEDTPSFAIDEKKKRARCFGGCGFSGDIFDFTEKFENVDNKKAIDMVRHYDGSYQENNSTHTPYRLAPTKDKEEEEKKDPEAIQAGLNKMAKALAYNKTRNKIFTLSYNHQEHLHNNTLITCVINEAFEKLFEKRYLTLNKKLIPRLEYIQDYVLAYDTFWKCPAIIIRDHKTKICDISKYRPQKPAHFESWADLKYMYLPAKDKQDHRGDNFLFPFSVEMDRLIDKHKFFFIGEGLKNAVNALLYGIPFISLESTSTEMREELIAYIKEKAKDKIIIGGFDGDFKIEENGAVTKGLGAYLKAKKTLGLEFNNLFAFDSEIDFADYLKDEYSLINFEKKFDELFQGSLNSTNHEKNLKLIEKLLTTKQS